MMPTLPRADDLQSLQSNPYVQDLLSALDAQTRDSVVWLLSSLTEDVLETLLEAVERLDEHDADIDTLVALLKGKQAGVDMGDRSREALHALLYAAQEHLQSGSTNRLR